MSWRMVHAARCPRTLGDKLQELALKNPRAVWALELLVDWLLLESSALEHTR